MKYIDAEKLIAILNDRIARCEKDEEDGYPDTTSSEATLKSILSIITSLQQEQPFKNLEKEIEKYLINNFTNDEEVDVPFLERRFAFWKDDLLRFAKHIAEWQKTKMMEDSFTTIMQTDDLGDRVPTLPDMAQYGYKEGDKVKVIIVNED